MADLGATVAMEATSGVAKTLYNPIHATNGYTAIASTQNGNWNTGSTWVGGVVPTSNQNAQIKHVVTVEAGQTRTIKSCVVEDVGKLVFGDGCTFNFWNLISNGEIEAGTVAGPISGTLVIRDIAVDPTGDPDQFWGGLIGIGGKVTCHGLAKSVTSKVFDCNAAAATITLYEEDLDDTTMTCGAQTLAFKTMQANLSADGTPGVLTGWAVGDRLFLPGMLRPQWNEGISQATIGWEFRTIASIAGNVITLNAVTTYAHHGQASHNGIVTEYPNVQNLTKSLTIKSESAAGVRGHTLYSHRCQVDLRYVGHEDMTRSKKTGEVASNVAGGVRGRYMFHLHHDEGPVDGFTPASAPVVNYPVAFHVYGCSFYNTVDPGTVTWNVAIHDSSFGYFGYNDINWAFGAGLITEEGIEAKNVIEHNRVMLCKGDGSRTDLIGSDDFGNAGSCIWFKGPYNYVRHNIAANAYGVDQSPFIWGINYYSSDMADTQVLIPNSVGVDSEDNPELCTLMYRNAMPFLECLNNKVYACVAGFTFWWIGMNFETPRGNAGTIQGLRVWQIFREGLGLFPYENQNLVVDGYCYLSSTPTTSYAINGSDYCTIDLRVQNCYCDGLVRTPVFTGVRGGASDVTKGHEYYQNSLFHKMSTNTPFSTNGHSDIPGKRLHLSNIIFHGSNPLFSTALWETPSDGNVTVADHVFVTDWNGSAGDNFIIQRPDLPDLPNPLAGRAAITGDLFSSASTSGRGRRIGRRGRG